VYWWHLIGGFVGFVSLGLVSLDGLISNISLVSFIGLGNRFISGIVGFIGLGLVSLGGLISDINLVGFISIGLVGFIGLVLVSWIIGHISLVSVESLEWRLLPLRR
jgi:hypothetical protein